MDYVLTIIFLMIFIVWLLFSRVGKGGRIDEALTAGLLEINRYKEENQEQKDS